MSVSVNGLRPMLMNVGGGPSRIQHYGKAAADSHAIYLFDVVRKAATSVANPEGGNPLPGIQYGGSGTPGTGLWLGSTLGYGIASTDTVHPVCDDSDAIFLAQLSGSTAKTVANTAGKTANFTFATGGSTTTKQSGHQIDVTTVNTTSGQDIRILNLLDSPATPDNVGGAILEIQIVLHQYGGVARTSI
jgi:hypothetical protein